MRIPTYSTMSTEFNWLSFILSVYRLYIVIYNLYLSIKSYISDCYILCLFCIWIVDHQPLITFNSHWKDTFWKVTSSHPDWRTRSKQLLNANRESATDLVIPPTIRLFHWKNPFCQALCMMTSSKENISTLLALCVCVWIHRNKQTVEQTIETPVIWDAILYDVTVMKNFRW